MKTALAAAATKAAKGYFSSTDDLKQDEGFFAAFDLKHDFPSEWVRMMNQPSNGTDRVLDLGDLSDRLPYFTSKYKDKLQTAEIYLVYGTRTNPAVKLSGAKLVLGHGENEDPHDFADSEQVPSFGKNYLSCKIDEQLSFGEWHIKFPTPFPTGIDEMWLVLRSTMTMPAATG